LVAIHLVKGKMHPGLIERFNKSSFGTSRE